MTKADEIHREALGLATNIVTDFTEMASRSGDELPRVLQISTVAGAIEESILKFASPTVNLRQKRS